MKTIKLGNNDGSYTSYKYTNISEIDFKSHAITVGEKTDFYNGVEIGFGCNIGENVQIYGYAKIGKFCNIGNDTIIYSAASNKTTIGEFCSVGINTTIDLNCLISENSIIGNDVKIGKNTKIGLSVIIHDNSILKENVSIPMGINIEGVVCEGNYLFLESYLGYRIFAHKKTVYIDSDYFTDEKEAFRFLGKRRAHLECYKTEHSKLKLAFLFIKNYDDICEIVNS